MRSSSSQVRLSFHALDRASQRLLALWEAERVEDEGLYTWLLSRAMAALETEPVERRRSAWIYEHRGIRFVVRYKLVLTVASIGDETRARRMRGRRWVRPFARLWELLLEHEET